MIRLALGLLLLSTTAAAEPVWPAADAPLHAVPLPAGKSKKVWRLYLDAGHGAPGNTGNKSCTCEDEQDETLRIATDLAAKLTATKRFKVKLSRNHFEQPKYQDRVAAAEAFHADALVSLHTDARGAAQPWEARPGMQCLRNDSEPGLGVLMSDEGPKRLVASRTRLARGLAGQLAAAGFLLYPGEDWMTLYAKDAEPGIFIDRRPLKQRVFVLRKPRVPSVIIETHHALDFNECARWKEPRTLDAFAVALANGLEEGLRPDAPKKPTAGPTVSTHP
jgi:N-acetylmuramoyl-L-alanine amidase